MEKSSISEHCIFIDVGLKNLAIISSRGHLARRLPAICLQAVDTRINGGGSIGLGSLSSAELENNGWMDK